MKKVHIAFLIGSLFSTAAVPFTAFAQPGTKVASKSSTAPSAADIADAKAKGLVWVNTSTKVYHVAGDKYYGNTKAGKFMTKADAEAAGNHLSGSTAKTKTKKTTAKM